MKILKFYKYQKGIRDFIQLQFFFCNYLGFTIRFFGCGVTLQIPVFREAKRRKE